MPAGETCMAGTRRATLIRCGDVLADGRRVVGKRLGVESVELKFEDGDTLVVLRRQRLAIGKDARA